MTENEKDFILMKTAYNLSNCKAQDILDKYISFFPESASVLNELKKDLKVNINVENISENFEIEKLMKLNEKNSEKNRRNFKMSENLKIKVDLRKVESEKNPELKGFADLTIGGIVIRDVAVKTKKTEKGEIVNFDMPTSRKYETQDGETKYVSAVEISNKNEDVKKSIIREIKKALISALTEEKPNEYGKYTIERDTDITYNSDNITSFVNPVSTEKDTSLKGFATMYIGGVLKLNDIAIRELQNNETGEYFKVIQMPQKAVVKDEETTYKDKVFPVEPGLRTKMKESIEESYEKEIMQDEEVQKEDEEEEEI